MTEVKHDHVQFRQGCDLCDDEILAAYGTTGALTMIGTKRTQEAVHRLPPEQVVPIHPVEATEEPVEALPAPPQMKTPGEYAQAAETALGQRSSFNNDQARTYAVLALASVLEDVLRG